MTLIVAHVSQHGAVMAADSLAAEGDGTAAAVDKIWEDGGLLFGYSGNMAIRDQIRRELARSFEATKLPQHPDWEMAGSALCAITKPVLDKAYANFSGAPGESPVDALGGSLVVIGFDGEQHWLLEIDANNTPSHYTNDGFHTIGSGSVAADVGNHVLRHYAFPGHETPHLRLLAFRTVASCIDVLGGAYGLGPPVQMWQSNQAGYEAVIGEALAAVAEGVEQWIQIEQESLMQVFPAAADAASHDEEALPEQLSPS